MAEYQWYPGHMTKARRMMQDNIRLVDLVIELTDARAPLSCRNPDIDALAKNKERIIVLNKSDLADPERTAAFLLLFERQHMTAAAIDSRSGKSADMLMKKVRTVIESKRQKDLKKGIVNRPVRAMVVGIPNVGKSTLINTLAGGARARTGNTPGVTKGKQWIAVNIGANRRMNGYTDVPGSSSRSKLQMDLLDTPGILWPKIEDPSVGWRLAALGAIRNEVLDETELAASLLDYLYQFYPEELKRRYPGVDFAGLEVPGRTEAAYNVLDMIARDKKLLLSGDQPDISRASFMLLDDFGSGRIGRITLDNPG